MAHISWQESCHHESTAGLPAGASLVSHGSVQDLSMILRTHIKSMCGGHACIPNDGKTDP